MHAAIIKVNELRNRGKKKANFHVLRESTMPALLTENGFIDNNQDASLMKKSSWRKKVAQGHVNGLAKAFNLSRKQSDSRSLYKVIAGSFKKKDNAKKLIANLSKKGIDSFTAPTTISGETWYRVQAGAFTKRKNAEKRLEVVKNARFKDAYILTDEVNVNSYGGYAILGQTYLSTQHMNQYVKEINAEVNEMSEYYVYAGE